VAAVTCTLTAMKAGLWSATAQAVAGRIVVADIGMPRTAWEECRLHQPDAVVGGALLTLTPA
jgi:hypothetical protein